MVKKHSVINPINTLGKATVIKTLSLSDSVNKAFIDKQKENSVNQDTIIMPAFKTGATPILSRDKTLDSLLQKENSNFIRKDRELKLNLGGNPHDFHNSNSFIGVLLQNEYEVLTGLQVEKKHSLWGYELPLTQAQNEYNALLYKTYQDNCNAIIKNRTYFLTGKKVKKTPKHSSQLIANVSQYDEDYESPEQYMNYLLEHKEDCLNGIFNNVRPRRTKRLHKDYLSLVQDTFNASYLPYTTDKANNKALLGYSAYLERTEYFYNSNEWLGEKSLTSEQKHNNSMIVTAGFCGIDLDINNLGKFAYKGNYVAGSQFFIDNNNFKDILLQTIENPIIDAYNGKIDIESTLHYVLTKKEYNAVKGIIIYRRGTNEENKRSIENYHKAKAYIAFLEEEKAVIQDNIEKGIIHVMAYLTRSQQVAYLDNANGYYYKVMRKFKCDSDGFIKGKRMSKDIRSELVNACYALNKRIDALRSFVASFKTEQGLTQDYHAPKSTAPSFSKVNDKVMSDRRRYKKLRNVYKCLYDKDLIKLPIDIDLNTLQVQAVKRYKEKENEDSLEATIYMFEKTIIE